MLLTSYNRRDSRPVVCFAAVWVFCRPDSGVFRMAEQVPYKFRGPILLKKQPTISSEIFSSASLYIAKFTAFCRTPVRRTSLSERKEIHVRARARPTPHFVSNWTPRYLFVNPALVLLDTGLQISLTNLSLRRVRDWIHCTWTSGLSSLLLSGSWCGCRGQTNVRQSTFSSPVCRAVSTDCFM